MSAPAFDRGPGFALFVLTIVVGAGLVFAAPSVAQTSARVSVSAAEPAVSPQLRAALAPSGLLRVGVYAGAPTSLVRDPVSGEARGVTVDLGRELARRLGVPVDFVEFQRVSQVVAAVAAGQADFTVTNATPARTREMDMSAPILDIEQGYLTPAGSPIVALEQVDRPGIVVGVTEGSTTQANLSRDLKAATLLAAPSVDAAIDLVASGRVQAYATNKSILFQMTDRLPGAKVLDGAIGREHMAIGIPKGRGEALAFIRSFAADAASTGLVERAAGRAGLRGSAKPQ